MLLSYGPPHYHYPANPFSPPRLEFLTPSAPATDEDDMPAPKLEEVAFPSDPPPEPGPSRLEGPASSPSPPDFATEPPPVVDDVPVPPKKTGLVKAKRAKRGTTCMRCKRQKARCDGVMPCAICVTHGEGATCTYRAGYQPPPAPITAQGTLVRRESSSDGSIARVSRDELLRLKATIDRFQTFVGGVNSSSTTPYSLASSLRDVKVDAQPLELEVDCIAGAFGRMLHKEDWGEYCREGERSPLVALGKRRLLTPASAESLEWTEEAPIRNPAPDPTTREECVRFVCDLMPTPAQAAALSKTFFAQYNWMLFPVQPQPFLIECQLNFGRPPGSVPWEWRAVVIAVCRIGLAGLSANPAAMQAAAQVDSQLADPATRLELADLWLRAALVALELADAEVNPTIEGFRAIALINFGFMFLGESSSAAGLRKLLMLHRQAVQMAFVLRLHHEPSKLVCKPPLTKAEEADRRNLWWALKGLGAMLANASGIFSTIVHETTSDVALPAEMPPPAYEPIAKCVCGGLCPPWNAGEGLRARYMLAGKLVGPITTLEFRRSPPPTYTDVLDLHRKMLAVLEELPDRLRLRVTGHRTDVRSISACPLTAQMQILFYLHYYYMMLRLHRPVHTLVDVGAANVPFHRDIVIQSARTLLDLRKAARIGSGQTLAGTYFVAAAVSLALDILQRPATEEALQLRAEVDELVGTFLAEARMPVMRRGKKVLEFLLEQINASLTVSGDGAVQAD